MTIAGIFVLSSCKVTDVSDEEQSASLAPYAEHTIKGAPVEHYVTGRTAILIGAEGMEVSEELRESSSENSAIREISFRFKYDQSKPIEAGTAFAIDSRGYFLTAGHCIDGREIYALYVAKDREVALHKVEPVWVRVSSLPEIDLALFRIDGEPYETFKWAESFENEDTVFSAGTTFKVKEDEDPPFQTSIDSFAGKIKKTREVSFKNTEFQLIWHRSPVRRGNSGGPLMNKKGELIGVNYAAATPIQRVAGSEMTPMSFAIRPDPQWIRHLIKEDWAKRQKPELGP